MADKKLVKLSSKEVLNRYYSSKDFNLANLYMRAIHQLVNIQLLYFDQLEDILKRNGLVKHRLKQSLNIAKNQTNLFEVEFRKAQGSKEHHKSEDFNKEFDILYEGLTKFFMKGEN